MWPGGRSTSPINTASSCATGFIFQSLPCWVHACSERSRSAPLRSKQPRPIHGNRIPGFPSGASCLSRVASATSQAAITPLTAPPTCAFPYTFRLLAKPPGPFLTSKWVQSTAQLAGSILPPYVAHHTRGQNKTSECSGLSSQAHGQTGFPNDTHTKTPGSFFSINVPKLGK